MKAYTPTRKIVDALLDGNPMGNVFLVNAIGRYADEVIKYEKSLTADAPGQLISPVALARTAVEARELMHTYLIEPEHQAKAKLNK